eukprot:CFRG7861T1
MKLVQVLVPHAQADKVYNSVAEQNGDMIFGLCSLLGQDNVLISCKCTAKYLQTMLNGLHGMDVGVKFGSVDVIELQTTIPQVKKEPKKKREYKSITDRKTVEEIYQFIDGQNKLTFDFLALVVSAAVMAGAGLVSDSAPVVVASMIVSPLMPPILGLCFGVIVRDKIMIYKSLRNELIGACICLLIGVIMGIGIIPFREEIGYPTHEMLSRGSLENVVGGAAVAVPSGIAVALAIAGGVSSTLVGVAISASLLPPLVNAGISFVMYLTGAHEAAQSDDLKMALVSLLLFFNSIFIIFVVGILVFKLKAITPMRHAAVEGNRTADSMIRSNDALFGDQHPHSKVYGSIMNVRRNSTAERNPLLAVPILGPTLATE